MTMPLLGALAIVVLAGCSMTVESARFPDVIIECGGAPRLSEGECLDWAEQMLSSAPVNTAKLVLTHRTGNARCTADYFAPDGGMLMTVAAPCPAS